MIREQGSNCQKPVAADIMRRWRKSPVVTLTACHQMASPRFALKTREVCSPRGSHRTKPPTAEFFRADFLLLCLPSPPHAIRQIQPGSAATSRAIKPNSNHRHHFKAVTNQVKCFLGTTAANINREAVYTAAGVKLLSNQIIALGETHWLTPMVDAHHIEEKPDHFVPALQHQ